MSPAFSQGMLQRSEPPPFKRRNTHHPHSTARRYSQISLKRAPRSDQSPVPVSVETALGPPSHEPPDSPVGALSFERSNCWRRRPRDARVVSTALATGRRGLRFAFCERQQRSPPCRGRSKHSRGQMGRRLYQDLERPCLCLGTRLLPLENRIRTPPRTRVRRFRHNRQQRPVFWGKRCDTPSFNAQC